MAELNMSDVEVEALGFVCSIMGFFICVGVVIRKLSVDVDRLSVRLSSYV